MAYVGFKKLEGMLAKKGARNPGAVAAHIAQKKYGKKALEKHAHAGTSMKHEKHLKGK